MRGQSHLEEKKILLVGDRKDSNNHLAIEKCFHVYNNGRKIVSFEWVSTQKIDLEVIQHFDGVWLTPGGPYQNDENVLQLINYMRLKVDIPFIANCSGFQYSIIEYFRNSVGLPDATSEELYNGALHKVVNKLTCSLSGNISQELRIAKGTLLQSIIMKDSYLGWYNCNYSLNNRYSSQLINQGDWVTSATFGDEIRALELPNKHFYLITLFQPAMEIEHGLISPIILSFFEQL